LLEQRILESLFTVGAVAFGFAFLAYKFVLEPQLGWLDCLYFSMATFTTVGYGDIHPSTAASRIFTVFVLFVTIIPVALALAATAEYLATQQELDRHRRERAMAKAVFSIGDVRSNAEIPIGSVVVSSVIEVGVAGTNNDNKKMPSDENEAR
jgi:voltage-gated potassium channel